MMEIPFNDRAKLASYLIGQGRTKEAHQILAQDKNGKFTIDTLTDNLQKEVEVS